MSPPCPEFIDLLDSSDEELACSRSVSQDASTFQDTEIDQAARRQRLEQVDCADFAVNPMNEAEFENEVEELQFHNDHESSLRKRTAFKKLLQSIESSDDLKNLYPASLSSTTEIEGYNERQLLRDLIKVNSPSHQSTRLYFQGSDFEELELQDFVVYRAINHSKGFDGQMEYLQNVACGGQYDYFSFDGVVFCDGEARRVIGLEISQVSFGGLDDLSICTTVDQIWIQTYQSSKRNETWYRLRKPAKEYQPYWDGFLWVSDFIKHVLDHLFEASKSDVQIGLGDFSHKFWEQIQRWHGHNDVFRAWHALCGNVTDFRKLLIRHGAFLWNQAYNMGQQDIEDLIGHPVWDDLALGDRYDCKSISKQERTVVTDDIGAAFIESFPAWGPAKYNLLRRIPMGAEISAARERRINLLGMPKMQPSYHIEQSHTGNHLRRVSNVEVMLQEAANAPQPTILPAADLVGKVAVIRLDIPADSVYARDQRKRFNFAWVSEILSQQKVHIVWLALPCETTCEDLNYDCQKTFYPVGNELFFTDKCTVITISNVVGVFNAAVFGREPESGETIRIRQLYIESEAVFVTAAADKLKCKCRENAYIVSDLHSSSRNLESRKEEIPKMKNLSLFSGAGLLDFALATSGTLETVVAIDHGEKPIRSHAANTVNGTCEHIIDSTNHVFYRYLHGRWKLPLINSITAGFPCKGFSNANKHKFSLNGQRNCSMLAHTLSWIDVIRPEYAIIENVPSMDSLPARKGVANACCQAIACLVAMGYQVRKMVLRASDFGNSTMRRRLFLVAAAPNCILPETPPPTHGDEQGLQPIQTLRRTFASLPKVHNDTQINLRHPDHIPVVRLKQYFDLGISLRNLVQRIPKIAGMGLVQAFQQGYLSRKQREWYLHSCTEEQRHKSSLSLRRVQADGLLPTIVTVVSPMCARIGGHIIHYNEDRTLTLEELLLNQGLPGSFLLIGNVREQIEQAANGVAWQMVAALGGSLSKAWTTTVTNGELRAIVEDPETREVANFSPDSLRITLRLGEEISEDRGGRREEQGLKKGNSARVNMIMTPEGDREEVAISTAKFPTAMHTQQVIASNDASCGAVEELGISDDESPDPDPAGIVRYRHNKRSRLTMITKGEAQEPKSRTALPRQKRRASASTEDDSEEDIILTESGAKQSGDVQSKFWKKQRRS